MKSDPLPLVEGIFHENIAHIDHSNGNPPTGPLYCHRNDKTPETSHVTFMLIMPQILHRDFNDHFAPQKENFTAAVARTFLSHITSPRFKH